MDKYSNPWVTLSSREVYQNPWFRLREDQVIRPDGQPGIYAVVEKSLAVAVLPVAADGDIYLVGQYRYPTQRYSWEIIEGGQEVNETALQTAARELQEEAGLIAGSLTMLGGELQLSNCMSAECGQIFLATDLRSTACSPEGTEVLELRKMPLSCALEMVYSGEIQDTLTIIGLHYYERSLSMKTAT